MNWRALDRELAPHGLFLMGTCPDDQNNITIALVGAAPDMWNVFRVSPEFQDNIDHPLDRWSKRVLAPIAEAHNADMVFPSDGPPYPPFIRWAEDSGRFWQSPTGMLVHDVAGLMISLRGALRIKTAAPIPQVPALSPCDSCTDQPCKTACPVGALNRETGYDVAACHAFLDTTPGQDCLSKGCKARRACPVSQTFNRPDAQSEFHMKAFHPT